jgi:hypothetical protein
MTKPNVSQQVTSALEAGRGILHLAPAWVPRDFLVPGRRIRLAQEDLYVLGAHRGGIDERWLASTTAADNGEGTPADEGLSYAVGADGNKFLLRDAIDASGAHIIGKTMMSEHGRWPVYAKFFDNMGPIAHHLHLLKKHADAVGRQHKPEAYYFPPQMNAVGNNFPFTFFGLEPGTSREDILRCLEKWQGGDNGILDLSKAYRLKPGTGWLVPAGILHAPGSLCTFEVQWGSDVFAMFQSMVEGRQTGWNLLTKDVPEGKKQDLDYIVSLIDWEANCDPLFRANHFLEPQAVADSAQQGYLDKWVIYGRPHGQDLFSARELTVKPGAKVTIKDPGASGIIAVQGRGKIGVHPIEVATYVRYGEMTYDEYFITDDAAKNGYVVENQGRDDLVILRYFGPGVSAGMPDVGGRK